MATKVVVSALAVTTALAIAAAASASPGAGSLASGDGSSIYMVTPQDDGTIVTKIRGSDRTAQVTRRLPGSFELPAIAGVTSGLSPDGEILVLGGHPAAHISRFALLDTGTLRLRRMLTLRGTYSFDALSPDASTLYLIRFLSSDGSHYAVQGLDVNDPKPVPRTLVEKGEPGEAMSGQPIARTTSPDGAWVYTLYKRAGEAPFVHALSTVDSFTVCIDLDGLAGRRDFDAMSLRLQPGGRLLDVTAAGTPVARVDMGSFEATTLPAPRRAGASRTADHQPQPDGRNFPWFALGGIALVAAAAVRMRMRRRRVSGVLRVRA
jgi:hypothetical protein